MLLFSRYKVNILFLIVSLYFMITFQISNFLEEILLSLGVMAERSASDCKHFLRLTACPAEFPMLRTFLEETLAWMSLKLKSCFSFSIDGDNATLSLLNTSIKDEEAKLLLMSTLRSGIIRRWMNFTGIINSIDLENEMSRILDSLAEETRRLDPLRARPIPPL